MAVSQFTFYTSMDPQGPGPVNGTSGSLINALDACLVNGYGTGSYFKASVGWSKPLPNVSASAASIQSQLACYKQASGSGLTLMVNDSGQFSSTAKEAWICGWEYMTALTGSGNLGLIYTASNGQGAGYGQFPLPAQLLTFGHCVVRKSVTTDTATRNWIIVADASTMYMWILTGDSTYRYYHFGFGEIFSLAGVKHKYRSFINARASENSATAQNVDWTGAIAQGGSSALSYTSNQSLTAGQPGCYMARNIGGTGGSQTFTKKGDAIGQTGRNDSSAYSIAQQGPIQCPNTIDNSIYMQPLQVVDPTAPMIRGRMRGLFYPIHPSGYFADGQTINNVGGDYAGKSFVIIKYTPDDNGMWAVESSNTVETNS